MVQTRNLLIAAAAGLASPALAEDAAATCTKVIRASGGDTCASLTQQYGITVAQFISYNPSINTCTLSAGVSYCVSQNPADGPPVEIPSGPGGGTVLIPSPDGSDGICGGSSGYTCLGSVYGDCCSQVGYCGNGTDYCGEQCNPAFGRCGGGVDEPGPGPDTTTACVPGATVTVTLTKFVTIGGGPGDSTTTTTIRGPTTTSTKKTTTTSTTTTTRRTTTTTAAIPSPTVSGTSTKCTTYHKVTARDNCTRLSSQYNIDEDKIDKWNPNFDCLNPSDYLNQYICVAGP